MKYLSYNLVKWGTLTIELCLLLVLCGDFLLCRNPLGSLKGIGVIVLAAAGSFVCAYLSSARFRKPWEAPFSWKRVILELPFALWFIAILFVLTYHPYHPNADLKGLVLYRTK